MKTNIINFMLVGANSQALIDPTHSVHILCFIVYTSIKVNDDTSSFCYIRRDQNLGLS